MRKTLVLLALVATVSAPAVHAADCTRDSTGMIPLIDLGAGLYHGFPGGLYGVGANVRPAVHDAAGIAIANALTPLDTLGNVDANGRIVLISIGMSNATQEFSLFVSRANTDAAKNPRVLVIDCAVGGQSADRIKTPTAAYWDSVSSRLRSRGATPAQVQVVWIKEANAGPRGGFPAATDTLQWYLGTIVRIIKDKLPNTKLAYFTSRIYAGYATTTLNPEPYAYESGFAVKWLIDAQIAGEDSLNFDPDSGPIEAPWLSWGPYLWADGLETRSDGLTWACTDFSTDGTHPATSGRLKVADGLLAFFKRDAASEPWFVNHSVSVGPRSDAEIALAVTPNPALEELAVTFTARRGRAWSLDLTDLAGRRVARIGRGVGTGFAQILRWNRRGSLAAGVYWVRFQEDQRRVAKRVVLIER